MIYLVLSAKPRHLAKADAFPFVSLENGEILCEAVEVYRSWHPYDDLEFEYALLLARAVSQEHTLELTRCSDCHRLTMVDGRQRRRKSCGHAAHARLVPHQKLEQEVVQDGEKQRPDGNGNHGHEGKPRPHGGYLESDRGDNAEQENYRAESSDDRFKQS